MGFAAALAIANYFSEDTAVQQSCKSDMVSHFQFPPLSLIMRRDTATSNQ
jgi:hypothetical protein